MFLGRILSNTGKMIYPNISSLLAICTTLSYSTDSQIYNYLQYLENYYNKYILVPQRLSTKSTTLLTDQS